MSGPTRGSYRRLSEHFHEEEFACHHCGKVQVDPKLVEMLEKLREALNNRPIVIMSGYRCPTHNKNVGGAPKSQHMLGTAADIQVEGVRPDTVADAADRLGFGGVGRYDYFTHVDVRSTKARWDERRKKG